MYVTRQVPCHGRRRRICRNNRDFRRKKPDAAVRLLRLKRRASAKRSCSQAMRRAVWRKCCKAARPDEVHAELLPAEKVGGVVELRSCRAQRIARFVGDGTMMPGTLPRGYRNRKGALGSDAPVIARMWCLWRSALKSQRRRISKKTLRIRA
jgi:hypothetical protein